MFYPFDEISRKSPLLLLMESVYAFVSLLRSDTCFIQLSVETCVFLSLLTLSSVSAFLLACPCIFEDDCVFYVYIYIYLFIYISVHAHFKPLTSEVQFQKHLRLQ